MNAKEKKTVKKQTRLTQGARKKLDARKVSFTFQAPEAREVYLAGDFNQWDTRSTPMKKDNQGTWHAEIELPPGSYEYKFFADGSWVHEIAGAQIVPNAFGTNNCLIQVE